MDMDSLENRDKRDELLDRYFDLDKHDADAMLAMNDNKELIYAWSIMYSETLIRTIPNEADLKKCLKSVKYVLRTANRSIDKAKEEDNGGSDNL